MSLRPSSEWVVRGQQAPTPERRDASCPRTTASRIRIPSSDLRPFRPSSSASPLMIQTAKLESAASRHYLLVNRSAHPSEPLRFDGQHSSSQAVGPYRSPAPSPAPGCRLSASRCHRRTGNLSQSFHYLNKCFRARRNRAPIDRRYTSSVLSAGPSSRAGS